MTTVELQESVVRLESLVSPLVGPVLYAEEVLLGPETLPSVVVMCRTTPRDLCSGDGIAGIGIGRDRDSAFAAAVGEAIERYSAAYVPVEDLVVGSADELGPLAVDPASFVLFSDEQLAMPGFPAVRFTRQTSVAWTRGFAIRSREPALLPAQLVYLAPSGLPEAQIGYASSNGLACRGTFDDAVLTGLLELLERDAFSIVWANRLSLPRLTWEEDDELLELERRCYRPTGVRFSAIDLSAFWNVPTVLGVARSDSDTHAPVGVGAACGRTVRGAIRKALEEAFHVLATAERLAELHPDREFADDGSDVVDFDDHVGFYASRARAGRTAFLDATTETRDVREIPPLEGSDVRSMLAALTERLDSAGASAYAVDVTSPDVRAAGFAVAKVVAPALCPLDVEHSWRHLGVQRLYDAAWQRGLATAPLPYHSLNSDPHPFP